jgi:hypothetical protein
VQKWCLYCTAVNIVYVTVSSDGMKDEKKMDRKRALRKGEGREKEGASEVQGVWCHSSRQHRGGGGCILVM